MWEKRGGEEAKKVHHGGMKKQSRQFQENKKHTRQCVRTVLGRTRGGIKE